MPRAEVVLVTDRGGHLQNARMLFEQMQRRPDAVLTTPGPEVASLRAEKLQVGVLPYLFSWWGKRRVWNPFRLLVQTVVAAYWVMRLRPRRVVSLGASDVVPFCYLARLAGARVFHVECMNQVVQPSVTGRLLYPICEVLYVQWEGLLACYGPRARYAGWVL
jgi:UDP-N-acetylglucosamine:LPS N-acetylglucosamine transferase